MVARIRIGPRPGPAVGPDGPGTAPSRLALVWAVAAVVITGWELFCYLAAPRSAHPTLSSLLDTLDASHGGKALAFALWLGLGWALAFGDLPSVDPAGVGSARARRDWPAWWLPR